MTIDTSEFVVGKNPCPRCRKKGADNAGNNMHFYGEGQGGHCFACGYTIPSDAHKAAMGWEEEEYEEVVTRERITPEQNAEIKSYTSCKGKGYRGIRDETNLYFGVRYSYNEETGEPDKMFVPTTIDGELVGYRTRVFPKDFTNPIGQVGKEVDLIGEFRFKANKRVCVISGGETKMLNTYQMLKDYQESKGYDAPAVVCSTLGESGAHKQVQLRYDFFNQFEKIVICLDADKAGKEATEKIAKVLPKGRVYIMDMRYKDADDYVKAGKEREFIQDYWAMKPYTPAGIVGSGALSTRMREEADMEKISFPAFMKRINEMTAGGVPLGRIVNIGAACVDADTEFFTGDGWKRIADYQPGDMVGQYTVDGVMEMVEPLAYIKEPCEQMYHLTTGKGVDMMLTGNHRFAFKWAYAGGLGPLNTLPFEEVARRQTENAAGFKGRILTTFKYAGGGIDIDEGNLRLQVAVIADGRVVEAGAGNYTQMRFNKKRKYDRLINLCDQYGLRYDDKGVNSQGSYEVIVWPKWATKKFDSRFYQCSEQQLKVILDEHLYWDACIDSKAFSATVKESADFIQFAYAATGVRATISLDKRLEKYENTGYCATVYPTTNPTVGIGSGGSGRRGRLMEVPTHDGFKYCFSVPSAFLVLRRRGKIFITGNSGIGKTVYVDEIVKHIAMYAPYLVGVVSMELNAGQYGTSMLSRHIGYRISNIADRKEKMEFLEQEWVKEKEKELFFREDGSHRFYLVDDRDGGVEDLKGQVEQLIISCGCKIIVLDPLQDILDGMTNEEQALFLKWQKGMIKSHSVTFFNINHVRKSGGGGQQNSNGAMISEEDFAGSSTIFKSAALNILLVRDKMNEDPIERNTTKAFLSKNRDNSETGPAGEYYYDGQQHKLYDKQEWLDSQPAVDFTEGKK